jgi:hypothetical protein
MKKAFLITYGRGGIRDCASPCWVDDDYDGDQYGDKCPITVGSNQSVVTRDEKGELWDWCLGYCKGAGDFDAAGSRGYWRHQIKKGGYGKAKGMSDKCVEWKVWLHVEGLNDAGDQVEGDDFFMPVELGSFDTREDAEDFAETAEALCKRGRRTRAADEIMRQVKNELKDRGFMTLALRLAEAQDILDERTD